MRRFVGEVAGVRILADDEMALERMAMVNEAGRGFAVEDGEITPTIVPPLGLRVATEHPVPAPREQKGPVNEEEGR